MKNAAAFANSACIDVVNYRALHDQTQRRRTSSVLPSSP